MIIVRVMGGTGNQMFQYALARKLKEMNKYVVLDIKHGNLDMIFV